MNAIEPKIAEIIVKQSKFTAYLYNVGDTEQVDNYLSALKKGHPKAKHICYAYKIGAQAKYSDDKEPHGTAGKPIYHIIDVNHLDDTLIVVVRYFGGVKLGAGPLTRAYLSAAKEVVKQVNI